MNKKTVKIKVQNGLQYKNVLSEILHIVSDQYDFIESDSPDFILFGPYGNEIPSKGDYIRIGYFCENIEPDLSICDWAFGIPREEEINSPKYARIQWHGLNPDTLVKNLTDNEIDRIISEKRKFCNFLYSHSVPYREEFFKQLSKYKKIDAPGKSMNNMHSIDSLYPGDIWERKRKFLLEYKFTIAFENYSYPGYQTEKLYDAMQCNSIPIYCGDPYIGEIFNTKSFINAPEFLKANDNTLIRWLERAGQMDFTDIRPTFYNSLYRRALRKGKAVARELKMRLQFNRLDFSDLIDQIIELDTNNDLYIQYLKEPWFVGNKPEEQLSIRNRWMKIFEHEQ